MVDKLKEGVTCEVASDAVEMTETMLSGWLGFSDYGTEPSENTGWTLFVPKTLDKGEPPNKVESL